MPTAEEYEFIVGIYEDVLKSGDWTIVEHRPIKIEAESFPPPYCVIDNISG